MMRIAAVAMLLVFHGVAAAQDAARPARAPEDLVALVKSLPKPFTRVPETASGLPTLFTAAAQALKADAARAPLLARLIAQYRAEAEAGDPVAQASLGRAYRVGAGVAPDGAEAVKWFRKSADLQHPDGLSLLAYSHASGEGGAKRDAQEALRLYRAAAAVGDPLSQYVIGLVHESGVLGARDEAEALRLFRLSAEQGWALGASSLRRMQGMGVEAAADAMRRPGKPMVGWEGRDRFELAHVDTWGITATFAGAAPNEAYTEYLRLPEATLEVASGRSVVKAGATVGGKEMNVYFAFPGADPETQRAATRFMDALNALRRWAVYVRDVQGTLFIELYALQVPKPEPGEGVRRALVQAQGAVRDKQYKQAVDYLCEALRLAPWSAAARYNLALALGELGQYRDAGQQMGAFLRLAPDAPQARAAQDQVYDWERKAKQ